MCETTKSPAGCYCLLVRFAAGSASWSVVGFAGLAVMLLLGGCGSPLFRKTTEIETGRILKDLSKIKVISEKAAEIPEIYKKPPQIVAGKDCVRLIYFTRYHTADEIAKNVLSQQFEQDPQQGESDSEENAAQQGDIPIRISQIDATNQLIVKCPSEEKAKEVLELLEKVDIPPIQVKVDCIISEIYADVTMDWETTLLIEKLFGEEITFAGSLPGASLRDVARSQIGLKLGYWRNRNVPGDQFRALIDILVSKGYMKILMNPSLEVVNGKTARIETSDHVPLPKEVTKGDEIYQTTEYKDVIDSLEVTPHVFADGYIGLETKAVIGSKSTPEGVKQIPILTKREIENEENRIRQGESLIIGGIKKVERRSIIRGIPFLKDIPGLGILFSSKDSEERAKEVLFIITPSISRGGVKHKKIIEDMKKKHRPLGETDAFLQTIISQLGKEGKPTETTDQPHK